MLSPQATLPSLEKATMRQFRWLLLAVSLSCVGCSSAA
jgi:hypothetical protein